jgi:translation initiation factor 3 subunit F
MAEVTKNYAYSIYSFNNGVIQNLTCRIHPVVIFNILDHYMRRNDDHRSIGTLVGYIHDGIVEIRNSFPVPHTEGQVVAVDNEAYSNFYSLHRRVSPKDIALGWYVFYY